MYKLFSTNRTLESPFYLTGKMNARLTEEAKRTRNKERRVLSLVLSPDLPFSIAHLIAILEPGTDQPQEHGSDQRWQQEWAPWCRPVIALSLTRAHVVNLFHGISTYHANHTYLFLCHWWYMYVLLLIKKNRCRETTDDRNSFQKCISLTNCHRESACYFMN